MKRLAFLLGSLSLFSPAAACVAISGEPAPAAMEITAAVDGNALTLQECYQLALKRSETLAVSDELIKEADAHLLQALSTALPHVSFISKDLWQDGSGSSAFTLKHVPTRTVNVNQTLFSGFKEFAAIAGSRHEKRQRQEERARAEELLVVDVANAFHLLLEEREDLAAVDAIRVALVERMDELSEREQLGRSRASEVKTIEVQLRRTEADLEQARNREALTRHLLEFLTGLKQVPAITDDRAALPKLEEESAYLQKADTRPDVAAAFAAWQLAQKAVTVAQAKLWPTVSADGNYYLDRGGVAKDIQWDALLTVTVPLFKGGETVGGIQEALSQARQARWHYVERQRSAEMDIRDAYARFKDATVITGLLEQGLVAAEESYRLQLEDYRRSLVNNLDVLQALQALENARRDHIHALREAKRFYWQLRAALGEKL